MTFLCSKFISTTARNILKSSTKAHNHTRYLSTTSTFPKQRREHQHHHQQQRNAFTYAGPRNLNEILQLELINNKSKAEVSDLWLTYHESKEDVAGLIMNGKEVKDVLSRASKNPFFVQPVFRNEGFFMLVSQFISPTHFLFAYLEDYKMDPNRAQPLLTFSLFDDLCHDKDLGLVRCDIVNKGITYSEGMQIVQNTINCYGKEGEYDIVKIFNSKPGIFDFEDYVAIQRRKWKMETTATTTTDDDDTKK